MQDIDTGFSDGKAQLDARLTPLGRAAGITEVELAQQLRAAFFGTEVFRQQRQADGESHCSTPSRCSRSSV